MVCKARLIQLKNDPVKYAAHLRYAKRYQEKRDSDPVRHAHYLKTHSKHHRAYYKKHKKKLSKMAKEKYNSFSEEKKRCICQRNKEARIRRRKLLIVKWGNRCQKCGYSDHPEILQFDHIRPLYRGTNGLKKVVSDHMLKEVMTSPKLFELLCPNCHILKTRNEITQLWQKKKIIRSLR